MTGSVRILLATAAVALVSGAAACGVDDAPPPVAVGEVRGAPIDAPAPDPAADETGAGDADDTAVAGDGEAATDADEAPADDDGEGATAEADPEADDERLGDALRGALGDDGADRVLPAPDEDGIRRLDWTHLADYDYVPPDPGLLGEAGEGIGDVPAALKEISGERVQVKGFLVPSHLDETTGEIAGYMVSRYLLGCCFGQMPQMNEWVDARGLGIEEGLELNLTEVIITGTMEVGEIVDEQGYVISIYRMDVESVEAAY